MMADAMPGEAGWMSDDRASSDWRRVASSPPAEWQRFVWFMQGVTPPSTMALAFARQAFISGKDRGATAAETRAVEAERALGKAADLVESLLGAFADDANRREAERVLAEVRSALASRNAPDG